MSSAIFCYYVNHDPAERLEATVIEGHTSDSWVAVQPSEGKPQVLTLGLFPEQARDLARKLFTAAGQAEACDAEAKAAEPQSTAV